MSPTSILSGPGLTRRRLRVADEDVVWLRAVLEGYDGLASLYGDGSGIVTLITTDAAVAELDDLVRDLCAEASILVLD